MVRATLMGRLRINLGVMAVHRCRDGFVMQKALHPQPIPNLSPTHPQPIPNAVSAHQHAGSCRRVNNRLLLWLRPGRSRKARLRGRVRVRVNVRIRIRVSVRIRFRDRLSAWPCRKGCVQQFSQPQY